MNDVISGTAHIDLRKEDGGILLNFKLCHLNEAIKLIISQQMISLKTSNGGNHKEDVIQ